MRSQGVTAAPTASALRNAAKACVQAYRSSMAYTGPLALEVRVENGSINVRVEPSHGFMPFDPPPEPHAENVQTLAEAIRNRAARRA